MAEGDATVLNHAKELFLTGAVDFVNDALRIILANGWAITPDGNLGYANVSANEIVAANYVATGVALGGKAVAQDDANNRASFDANDAAWVSLGAAVITSAILYDDTVAAPVADPLLIAWEIATNSNGGNYTLQFHADGVLLLS